MLFFEQVNTALICFVLIAGEHKIELSRDRLVHEYGLSRREIPEKTLLRMARDLGLRARSLRASWRDLARLGKAFPVLARLKNGRHVVLTGLGRDRAGKPLLGLYDPLSREGHLRMGEEAFSALWGGELCLFKRVYRLGDEEQPFSLRWFIPEFLRQKAIIEYIIVAILFK